MSIDNSYAQPFRAPTELAELAQQVLQQGLQVDPWVGPTLPCAVCGLNVAVGWPLPSEVNTAYAALQAHLARLPGELYVYPLPTTHITLVTCVDFKSTPRSVDTERDVRELGQALTTWLSARVASLPRPAISIGPPLLGSRAAFFPIVDCNGVLTELRALALRYCQDAGGALAGAKAPTGFHSTLLRFATLPPNALDFLADFNAIARQFKPVHAVLSEAVVSLELGPYMTDAEALGRLHFAG